MQICQVSVSANQREGVLHVQCIYGSGPVSTSYPYGVTQSLASVQLPLRVGQT